MERALDGHDLNWCILIWFVWMLFCFGLFGAWAQVPSPSLSLTIFYSYVRQGVGGFNLQVCNHLCFSCVVNISTRHPVSHPASQTLLLFCYVEATPWGNYAKAKRQWFQKMLSGSFDRHRILFCVIKTTTREGGRERTRRRNIIILIKAVDMNASQSSECSSAKLADRQSNRHT